MLALKITLKTPQSGSFLYTFTQRSINVGRGVSCDICVPYPWVSIAHFKVIWSEETLRIFDLHARHPASVNGTLLKPTQPYVTQHRAMVTLFDLRVELKISPLYGSNSTHSERQRHLWNLWSPESGWILWWRSKQNKNSSNHDPQLKVTTLLERQFNPSELESNYTNQQSTTQTYIPPHPPHPPQARL